MGNILLVKILVLVRPLFSDWSRELAYVWFWGFRPPFSDTSCHGADRHWSLALKAALVVSLVRWLVR